jgi:hypothetical protein
MKNNQFTYGILFSLLNSATFAGTQTVLDDIAADKISLQLDIKQLISDIKQLRIDQITGNTTAVPADSTKVHQDRTRINNWKTDFRQDLKIEVGCKLGGSCTDVDHRSPHNDFSKTIRVPGANHSWFTSSGQTGHTTR